MREYVLAGHRVSVHWVDLSREPLRNDWLDDDEHVRAQRFARDELRDRFTAAHCALRRILGEALGVSPHTLGFRRDGLGKPSLTNANGLHFNLSHSEQHAVVALTSVAVGVDVEKWILSPTETLAAEVLDAVELTDWLALAMPQRRIRLTQLWAAKEAALKAAATGLRVAPSSFAMSQPLHLDFDQRTYRIDCSSIDAPTGYCAALGVVSSQF